MGRPGQISESPHRRRRSDDEISPGATGSASPGEMQITGRSTSSWVMRHMFLRQEEGTRRNWEESANGAEPARAGKTPCDLPDDLVISAESSVAGPPQDAGQPERGLGWVTSRWLT